MRQITRACMLLHNFVHAEFLREQADGSGDASARLLQDLSDDPQPVAISAAAALAPTSSIDKLGPYLAALNAHEQQVIMAQHALMEGTATGESAEYWRKSLAEMTFALHAASAFDAKATLATVHMAEVLRESDAPH